MDVLRPVAFDIETTGLQPDDRITVVGLATADVCWLGLNTAGREIDADAVAAAVRDRSSRLLRLTVTTSEADLLRALRTVAREDLDSDTQYLTAFNGETWNGGFDLPFLRRACARQSVPWPFPELAYKELQSALARFETGDVSDLCGLYDALIGDPDCDPFDDSAAALAAFEDEQWVPLLLHNLADIQRTHALALLADRYVPKSDFTMKTLAPPASGRD